VCSMGTACSRGSTASPPSAVTKHMHWQSVVSQYPLPKMRRDLLSLVCRRRGGDSCKHHGGRTQHQQPRWRHHRGARQVLRSAPQQCRRRRAWRWPHPGVWPTRNQGGLSLRAWCRTDAAYPHPTSQVRWRRIRFTRPRLNHPPLLPTPLPLIPLPHLLLQAKELGAQRVVVTAEGGAITIGRLYGLDVSVTALNSAVHIDAL
jgi:hypothetical protein